MACFRSQLLLADLDPFKGLPLIPNVIMKKKYSIFLSILDGNLPLTENPNLQPKEITPFLPEAVKKFRQREIGGPGSAREGEISFRQNRRLFLRGPVGIELTEA